MSCIRKVHPDADIEIVGSSTYPITVTITKDGKQIWSGSQKRLFRKYASDREQAMEEIVAAVKAN